MRLRAEGHIADLIIGNNVLAQVPDLNGFVAGMKTLLAPDGVIATCSRFRRASSAERVRYQGTAVAWIAARGAYT